MTMMKMMMMMMIIVNIIIILLLGTTSSVSEILQLYHDKKSRGPDFQLEALRAL